MSDVRLVAIRAFLSNVLLTIAALAATLPTSSLSAAMIIVTSTQDALSDSGLCTLREAVIAANTNAPSGSTPGECVSGSSMTPDTIILPAGTLGLSLAGAESDFSTNAAVGDLDITQSLNIQGQGMSLTTVTAAGLGARAFHVDGAAVVAGFVDIRISGGVSATGNGGGIFLEDGISMNLTRVSLSGNQAAEGGGTWATSTANVVVTDSVLSTNVASDGGGGGINWSGCFACPNTLSIANSRIEGNQALGIFPGGGGILVSGGVFNLSGSTIAENHADGDGEGIWMGDAAFSATGSTIYDNDTDGDGGGIWFDFPSTSEMDNCTLSGNSANGAGGGVAILSNEPVTLKHCTVAANTAANGSAIGDGDQITLANSIVSGTCAGSPVTTLGGNIESPGDNCGVHGTGDLFAVPAGQLALAPLDDNGGIRLTHLPGPSSVAINAARAVHCLSTDQRGLERPIGSGCDIGSVEVDPDAIFVNGFETGTTSAWSSTVP